MAVDWLNVRATASIIFNIMTVQFLFGFIISYYIVMDNDIYSYATTIDQSSTDNKKIRYFYLGALLSAIPSSYASKYFGIRFTYLIASLAFSGLLPIVSVVQQQSNHDELFLSLLGLAGFLFGVVQIVVMQGACMVEILSQSCSMGRFYSFSQVCTILGLLAGTSLASKVGYPGSFPSINTFCIALAIVIVSSMVTFCGMYNLEQEIGVRERIASWSSRRSSLYRNPDSMRLSLLQDEPDFSIGGMKAGNGRLLHAPLDDREGGSFRSNRSSSVSMVQMNSWYPKDYLLTCFRWAYSQGGRAELHSLVVVIFISTIVINTLEYWSYSYYEQALGLSGNARAIGVTSTRASLCVGYAVSDFIRPVFALRQWRVVFSCSFGAIVGVIFFLSASGMPAASTGIEALATVGSIIIGAFLAPLLPLCTSVSFTLPDMTPGAGVALVFMVGFLSHILASSIIGALASSVTMQAAMMSLGIVVLLLPWAKSLPTPICLLIDIDAFHVVLPPDASARSDSFEWS